MFAGIQGVGNNVHHIICPKITCSFKLEKVVTSTNYQITSKFSESIKITPKSLTINQNVFFTQNH